MLIKDINAMKKTCLSFILVACFFLFVFLTAGSIAIAKPDVVLTTILFSLLYLGILIAFSFKKEVDPIGFIFVSLSIAALLYIRLSLLYFDSRDYNIYLSQWLAAMRQLSIKEALVTEIGDYNLPYLYYLIIISRFKSNDLILIKFLSCGFDFLAAYFVMKIVSLKTEKEHWRLLSFVLALSIPTVILNSSYWGQCDSVYAAFCIASLYFAMKDRGLLSVIMFSLGFVFKLQSIFIVPALIICLIIGKIKPIHTVAFPITFLLGSLPAMLAGRSLFSIIGIYVHQTGEYTDLVLNAPSIFQLVGNVDKTYFKYFGIFLTGIIALCFVYICYIYKEKIKEKDMVVIFFISSLLMPYFLPCMHDRYFFVADVLSLVVFFYDRKKWYLPIITVFASFVSYCYYLMGGVTLVDQRITSLSLLFVLVALAVDFVKNISVRKVIEGE